MVLDTSCYHANGHYGHMGGMGEIEGNSRYENGAMEKT